MLKVVTAILYELTGVNEVTIGPEVDAAPSAPISQGVCLVSPSISVVKTADKSTPLPFAAVSPEPRWKSSPALSLNNTVAEFLEWLPAASPAKSEIL